MEIRTYISSAPKTMGEKIVVTRRTNGKYYWTCKEDDYIVFGPFDSIEQAEQDENMRGH